MAVHPQVWRRWLDHALVDLEHFQLGRHLLPLEYPAPVPIPAAGQLGTLSRPPGKTGDGDVRTFPGLGPWDRETVEIEVSMAEFEAWLCETPCTGQQARGSGISLRQEGTLQVPDSAASHKLLLFSGNDYLGLSAHPAVRTAAAKAALECGMGPRAAALVCGYTHHHRKLESTLAKLKHSEECLLCPTGFAANMAVMTALASTITGGITEKEGSFAIFSDALNHASIIDGVRLAQKTGRAQVNIYRHSDMNHLEQLLLQCKVERRVVVTDSLFSMDGDFAKMTELAALRKKYNFLLVVDDAHGTLVCGDNGGGVAEAFGVEKDIDICVGTLSKAIGCLGGFIATSRKLKKWIQSRGRSFIFSTALPIPVVAAAHAALLVAEAEKWRRLAVWERVQQLSKGLGVQFVSPIIPIVIGGADESVIASRELLKSGFHVFAIRPPTVKEGASRLRITVSAAHTKADVDALISALPLWIKEKGRSQPFLNDAPLQWLPSCLKEKSAPGEMVQVAHNIIFLHPKL
ncbi:unnamed protein product [Calypogeia fissa]